MIYSPIRSDILKPTFTIIYQGKDISQDLEPYLGSIRFTDRLHAASSDVEIELENRDRRWLDTWLPNYGDELKLSFGYQGQPQLTCPRVEFDEADFSAPPERARIRFLATDVTSNLRTDREVAYEKTTLKAIAQTIADRHKLKLVGAIPNIAIDRASQSEQTDLQFLVKLAEEYDLLVTVQDKKIIFYSWEELEARPIIVTLDDEEIREYRIPWKFKGVYKKAVLEYQLGKSKTKITHTESDPLVREGEVLRVSDRVENAQQAQLKCKAALRKANRRQIEADITLAIGSPWAMAGVNIDLKGYGRFSGKYQVLEAEHDLSPSGGWGCRLSVRKVDRVVAP